MNVVLRTRKRQQISVDCVISENVSGKIIVLGMQAIKAFGFQFFVGGQEAKMRTLRPTARTNHQRKIVDGRNRTGRNQRQREDSTTEDEDSSDDDRMSFLDEEEARMIRGGDGVIRT